MERRWAGRREAGPTRSKGRWRTPDVLGDRLEQPCPASLPSSRAAALPLLPYAAAPPPGRHRDGGATAQGSPAGRACAAPCCSARFRITSSCPACPGPQRFPVPRMRSSRPAYRRSARLPSRPVPGTDRFPKGCRRRAYPPRRWPLETPARPLHRRRPSKETPPATNGRPPTHTGPAAVPCAARPGSTKA